MTEYGLPFDGQLLGDATVAPYSATEWARHWALRHDAGSVYANYGVFKGTGGGTYEPLEVRETGPASSSVEVQVGAGLVNGRFYETTAVVSLSVVANSSGNPRIDTVLVRVDYVAQTARLAIKQGTPAASPARQTLQQDTLIWELPIADIAVANGFTVINQADISQRRRYIYTSDIGWQPFAYPINYIPSGAYGGGSLSLPANGGTVVIPVAIVGNMLLQQVSFYTTTVTSAFEWGWDLYVEDKNDGNTAENTLRRVAQSNGNESGTLPGAASTRTLAVQSAPVPLAPGCYWLAVQNRHATNGITTGSVSGGVFAENNAKTKTTSNPNGLTLDFVTGWSAISNILPFRLSGRVFGQTTVYG